MQPSLRFSAFGSRNSPISTTEVWVCAVTDGTCAVPLVPAQDFKRIGDGDTGPNTGGMGAYAPLPWAPPNLVEDVLAAVVRPTLGELRRLGTPFAGLLYVGLVLTADGPKVIEFNCRFGDPETQAVLALLKTPLAGLLYAAATGRLAEHPPLVWRAGSAVTVVVAAAGYPGTPRTGDPISGADAPGVIHAGTRLVAGKSVGVEQLAVHVDLDGGDAGVGAGFAPESPVHLDGHPITVHGRVVRETASGDKGVVIDGISEADRERIIRFVTARKRGGDRR